MSGTRFEQQTASTDASGMEKTAAVPQSPVTPVHARRITRLACPACGAATFRRSRLRLHDLPHLVRLRYPVRCKRCNQRAYAHLLTAGLA